MWEFRGKGCFIQKTHRGEGLEFEWTNRLTEPLSLSISSKLGIRAGQGISVHAQGVPVPCWQEAGMTGLSKSLLSSATTFLLGWSEQVQKTSNHDGQLSEISITGIC